jgi:hypothetical protein
MLSTYTLLLALAALLLALRTRLTLRRERQASTAATGRADIETRRATIAEWNLKQEQLQLEAVRTVQCEELQRWAFAASLAYLIGLYAGQGRAYRQALIDVSEAVQEAELEAKAVGE